MQAEYRLVWKEGWATTLEHSAPRVVIVTMPLGALFAGSRVSHQRRVAWRSRGGRSDSIIIVAAPGLGARLLPYSNVFMVPVCSLSDKNRSTG